MAAYPVVIDLARRTCVVIGGGGVGERKVDGLLAAGATVTVVSPILSERLAELARAGDIRHVARRYRRGDLFGATLAFVATDDPTVTAAVLREGRRRGVWVNAADDPAHCDFFLPSVLRRGPLLVAVATGGASPALARAVREEIERLLPADYEALAETVAEVRRELRGHGRSPDAATWNRALSTELRQVSTGGEAPGETRARLLDHLRAHTSISRGATAVPGRRERRGAWGARG